MYDIAAIRHDFPNWSAVHGKKLVYLDTRPPLRNLNGDRRLVRYYSEYNANVHRGIHALSDEAQMPSSRRV